MKEKDSCMFTIFGATGDLTHRKLLPALYFLERPSFFQTHGFCNCDLDMVDIFCVPQWFED